MIVLTKQISKRTLGVLALILAMVFWGVGPVVVKVGLSEVPPFSMAFLRNLLSLLILFPIVLYLGKLKIKKHHLLKLLLIGSFGSGINTAFFLSGVSLTSASIASTIFASVPLVNALAAVLILKELATFSRIAGVVVGFAGALIITLGPLEGDVLGNFLVVVSVFTWVAYIIGSKKLLKIYSPLTIIFFSILAGIMILFPLFLLEFLTKPDWFLNVGADGIGAIIYGGIISGIVAFFLFQWGMQYTSAFEAGIVTYLNPIMTDIFAVPVLGEKLSPMFLLGTALILGGVFLATTYEFIKKRREK